MHDQIYHKLIETMNDGLGILDENGFITFANEKICQMVGCAREDIIGRHVADFIDADDLQAFQERFEAHRKGIFTAFELTCRRTDGQKISTIVSPGPIVDDQGNFRGGFAVITDITELKKTGDALRESEQRFRAIFDNAFDGILVAEPQGKKLVTGNQAICEMLGYSPEELQAMTVYDIHPQEHLAKVLNQFERIARGEVTVAYDIPVQNKHGRVLYVDISCSHLALNGRRYLMGIFRDITQRKQSEEKKAHWNEQLESLVLERTKQLEAVVEELENEIIERRKTEKSLRQSRSNTQGFCNEVVKSLTDLQTSLRDMVYAPSDDLMFKLGDMHMLVEGILEKLRKGNLTLL
jgi:PAS domain S-box-containing protein